MASTNKTHTPPLPLRSLMATTPYSFKYYTRGEGKRIKYQALLHAGEETPKPSTSR